MLPWALMRKKVEMGRARRWSTRAKELYLRLPVEAIERLEQMAQVERRTTGEVVSRLIMGQGWYEAWEEENRRYKKEREANRISSTERSGDGLREIRG
jgi:hypothetical protein